MKESIYIVIGFIIISFIIMSAYNNGARSNDNDDIPYPYGDGPVRE